MLCTNLNKSVPGGKYGHVLGSDFALMADWQYNKKSSCNFAFSLLIVALLNFSVVGIAAIEKSYGVIQFELWWTSFKAKGPSVAAYVFTVTFKAGNSNFSHLLGSRYSVIVFIILRLSRHIYVCSILGALVWKLNIVCLLCR